MDICKIGIICIGIAIPSPAFAFEGEHVNNTGEATSLYEATVPFEFDVKWSLGTLMGEPVRNLSMRWSFPFGAEIVGEKLTPFDAYSKRFAISDLPKSIQKTIRLYDVKVKIGFSEISDRGRFSSADVTFDAGVPAADGNEWSYNVPGSPAWEKFVTRPGMNTYFSKEEAKAVLKEKNLYSVWAQNVSAKVKLGEALRWLRRKSDKAPLEYMLKGARKHLKANEKYAGLPVGDIALEFEILDNQLARAGSITALDDVRTKLAVSLKNLADGVPESYRVPALADEYDKARTEVSKWIKTQVAELNTALNNFETDTKTYKKWVVDKKTALGVLSKNRSVILSKLDLHPVQEKHGKRWGYKTKGIDQWVIKPRFLGASRFNSNETAVVTIDTEKRYERVKRGGRCGSKTYWKSMDVTYYKSATIDKAGKQVGSAHWATRSTRSALVLCSKRS